MEEHTENKNNDNQCHILSDLKLLAHTGSHGYTKLSFASSTKLNECNLDRYCKIYPQIQNIDVSNNELPTLKNLSQLKYLKWINTSHNKLTEFDLAVEWDINKNTGNKSLELINASHNNIIKLGCLFQHIHIEILDLSHNKLQNIDELSSLYLLRNLNISHNNITDLSPLNKISIIKLNASHNNIHKMDAICPIHMKICNMNENNITNLDCLAKFVQLTEFYIAKNNISDFESLNNLTKLSLLRNLDVQHNPIECETITDKILWILPDLEFLNGEKVDAKSKIKSQFKHNAFDDTLRSIKEYYIIKDDTKFDDNQNKQTTENENENEFWYRIVEEGFAIYWEQFITKFPSLSTDKIDLSDIQIGNVGLHAICDSIEECENLTHLIFRNCLSSNRWSDTQCKWPLKYLCDTLLIKNTLIYLDLSNCCIDCIKFEPIGYLIEKCICLNTINLNHNNIGKHIFDKTETNIIKPCPAIKILTNSVLKSKSLIKLYINHNNIDGLGAYFIGKCLQHKECVLQDLDISYNSLGKNGNGFVEIAKSIESNSHLKVFDISYCIQDKNCAEYMEIVFNSLKENKYLQNFNISGNMLSENAMKYLSLTIKMNMYIECIKMKDIVIDNKSYSLLLYTISNKNNFTELSIDIQSINNITKLINSISNHTNLKNLYLSNIQQQKYESSQLILETVVVQKAFLTLVTFDLSKLYLSSHCIHQIIDALYQSNEFLQNLNLQSSELNQKCWDSLTKLCNKLPLKQLNISQCSINDNCHMLNEFFQSKSVTNSLIDLNMSNMKWNNNKPMKIFAKLFDKLQFINNQSNREFTFNLTELPINADTIMNEQNFMYQIFTVLSKIGVKKLILDHFVITNNEINNMHTSTKLIYEILHCFAQNRFKISSLSIKHDDAININSQDDSLFSTLINSIKLQHISLPKIDNKDALTNLLSNLKNHWLKSIQLENEINEHDMNIILSTNKFHTPQIITNKFMNVASKSMDRKLNQYTSDIAYIKYCRV